MGNLLLLLLFYNLPSTCGRALATTNQAPAFILCMPRLIYHYGNKCGFQAGRF